MSNSALFTMSSQELISLRASYRQALIQLGDAREEVIDLVDQVGVDFTIV